MSRDQLHQPSRVSQSKEQGGGLESHTTDPLLFSKLALLEVDGLRAVPTLNLKKLSDAVTCSAKGLGAKESLERNENQVHGHENTIVVVDGRAIGARQGSDTTMCKSS
eukprot:gnl/TRDRNA2_/TRDRNA2_29061_c0_seq1.p1 gnl/TRDRNA2_/TRDRNA2_29061_c0~~gnl/TRDRNA2_/TRDRNA2_29061_c0_seq1.p1  ORF type:complete len:108 (+),score=2.41 gnl/TRDRNA2_/TRDRNA2_29061_c0_seq1:59-382(+)